MRQIFLSLCVPLATATALQVTQPPPPRPAPKPATPAAPRPERTLPPRIHGDWPDTPLPPFAHGNFELLEHWPTPMPSMDDLHWKLEGLAANLKPMKFELDEKLHALEMTRLEFDKFDVHVPPMDFQFDRKPFEMTVPPMEMSFDAGHQWAPTPKPGAFWPHDDAPFATRPRAPWAQGDPADSLYKSAYEMLNRGEWRRAANAFNTIPQRFPSSVYAPEALYWQAFSLYRIGNTDDLQAALRSLETLRGKYPSSAKTRADAAALTTRIRGTLAARGDRTAEAALRDELRNGQQSCDREDQQVRSEALRALAQTDPSSIVPSTRRVLARKDQCSAGLRRTAINLLGNSGDKEAPEVLREVALNDPESEVRSSAIQWLARSSSDVAVNTLEEILKTSTEQNVLRSAARALASNPHPRAKPAVRTLIERADAPERLRMEAISGFENGERTTEDDAAYLRSVYAKIDNPRIKGRIARVIGQLGGETNDQWLMGLMRDNNEPVEVRRAALERVASRNMPIGEAVKLYTAVADRQLREQLINVYSHRKEPEATDKLLDIVKNDTDYNLRRQAISALTRKNDPRATKLLLEIIDK